MVIREMNREGWLRVLARARLARLACAHENQPYVVPAYLAYHQPIQRRGVFLRLHDAWPEGCVDASQPTCLRRSG